MQTENIRYYLAFAYSDEQLAALLAHAESGKLSWYSCCCLVGIPTAPHSLKSASTTWPMPSSEHLQKARELPFGEEADHEYLHLGMTDAERRRRLIPLIHDEMERRGKLCDEFLESIHEESAIG